MQNSLFELREMVATKNKNEKKYPKEYNNVWLDGSFSPVDNIFIFTCVRVREYSQFVHNETCLFFFVSFAQRAQQEQVIVYIRMYATQALNVERRGVRERIISARAHKAPCSVH